MSKMKAPLEDYLDKIDDMLATLTPEQRDEMLQHASLVRYKKNEVIYKEGDLPTNLMCLVSGKIKIYRDGVGGRAQIMRVLGATEYFAYRAYMEGKPFITAAAAFEPCSIIKIPLGIVVGYIKKNPMFGWFFIQRLAHDLGVSDERTVNLTQKHIRGRLAESLLFLKESYGVEQDGSTLSIYLSREDLANLSNMTTSNAIRTLSAFASERIIGIDGRKIQIINEHQLRTISDIG